MNLKHKLQTLALGAVISSTLFHGVAMADTITVAKGDTLWKLSQKHSTSVEALKSANALKSNTIYVGQKLEVNPTSNNKTVNQAKSIETNKTTSTVYVVQKGDTLYKIGKKFGVSYQNIQKWNNLSSTSIKVGQKLNVSGTVQTTSATTTTTTTTAAKEVVSTSTTKTANAISNKREALIAYAKKFKGVPYQWGGTTPSGFDCSGFMYYTLKSQGLVSSRLNVAGYWSQVEKTSQPVAGDLVFFQNTYKSGPSHMGIYLGNGQFIHAGSNGVAIDSTSSSYWKQHFLGYGTFF